MERNETQVIVSQIIYLFIWWRVRHCTVSATSVACSHTHDTHAHSESGRRLTLDQPTNQLTNYCDRPTIGTFEVVRWWLGLVALVCSVRRTLSHVVRPVALGSDDLNFKWGTTGPFKVSRPLVGKKSKFLWGDKTKLMETHEQLRPQNFWGLCSKSKCRHNDQDDHGYGHIGHNDHDEIRRIRVQGMISKRSCVFDGSRWKL